MKTIRLIPILLLATVVGFGLASCGDDDSPVVTPSVNGNEDNNGKTQSTERTIDTELYIIEDSEILMGVNTLENGWYSYVLQFGFGASGNDAYYKGVTQIKLTAWADNGCLDISYNTKNYGKNKTYTLYLSTTKKDWYEWIYVNSKERKVTFNYNLEYYNSKDGKWYNLQSRRLTFNAQ